MFLLNQWYVAALPSELADKPLARTICDIAIVMFRTESGVVSALDDRCPHRYAPLSYGECKGEAIICPYHGIEFGPDGTCVNIPHQDSIPDRMCVASYPLIERWGWLWIWMGDPAQADPADIPDFWWLDSPDWHSFRRCYYINANYEICADNLLDLSHTPFIHRKTVGVPEMATLPVKTWVEGENVFQERVMTQVNPSPFVAEWGDFKGKIDRRASLLWRPPGNIDVELLYEDEFNSITTRLANPITPETENSTHVWFAWSRDFGSDSDTDEMAMRFQMQSFAVMDEDLGIMEMQQETVARGKIFRPTAIDADKTLNEARRIILDLAQKERMLKSKMMT
jgi:phenylpropionate dioxygenase-like ring-hydroxylating dioxygenase large terminal subunit